MPIPADVEPTPAICNMCAHFAWRAVDETWDKIFAPILTNESRVHDAAFRSFVYANENNRDKHLAFEVFTATLRAPKNSFWKLSDFDVPMKETFKGYWKLAIIQQYWQPTSYKKRNGWLPFQFAVDTWKALEAPMIDDWKAELEIWRSDN